MTTRNYELTYIVKPDIDAAALTVVNDKVIEIIAADGGSVVKTEVWGSRKLGYPIRKYKEGHYVHLVCALPPAALKHIDTRLRLYEDLLRHLMVVQEENKPVKVAPVAETEAEAPAEAVAPAPAPEE